MKSSFLLALLVLFIGSCQQNEKEHQSINGVWQSVGSGWILQIEDSTKYALYDITSISCLPSRAAALSELSESLKLTADTLTLLKGVITYKFTKIDQLPELCRQPPEEGKRDGLSYNFDVFAETVKEHYAFMELNNINWEVLYQQQREQLNEHSTKTDLYLLLEETLEKLNDNHAFLEADDAVYEAIEQRQSAEASNTETGDDLPEYGDFQIAAMVAKHHLKEEMTEDSWLIQWGKLEDNIGYIQVKSMWLYADLDIPESLIEEMGYVDAYVATFYKMNEGAYIKKEVEGVSKIMDQVMHDLKDMETMVIDVRFNGGGQDAVSFEILRRFNAKKQQVATQKLKFGNQFSPTIPLHVAHSSNAFTNPVYVLTSPQTGSAAEAFAIATIDMEHIKRIGSPTSGAMSTALEKTLPNGWTFSISNEVYMDNQGVCYENKGVPVDHTIVYPTDRQPFFRSVANELEQDKRDILSAIDQLKM